MGVHPISPLATKIVFRAGAFVLGDLIFGLTSFSVISSASLWIFALGWIRLTSEYAAMGQSFGSPVQLDIAWFGAFAGIPTLIASAYLGLAALRMPIRLFQRPIPARTG